jgi:hypothetical protein
MPSLSPRDSFLLALAAIGVASCGAREPSSPGVVPDALAEPLQLDAACAVTLDSPPLLPADHVPIGSDIQWDSNPPSSGPHYPIWAAYETYDSPVPRGYYVHDLEHGAVVLLYNCPSGCPDAIAVLEQAANQIPTDPLCVADGEGIRVRVVITPDPLLDVPVAAAAWGWTYRAQCADLPTLGDFAQAHYGQGPEQICANGTPFFDTGDD